MSYNACFGNVLALHFCSRTSFVKVPFKPVCAGFPWDSLVLPSQMWAMVFTSLSPMHEEGGIFWCPDETLKGRKSKNLLFFFPFYFYFPSVNSYVFEVIFVK